MILDGRLEEASSEIVEFRKASGSAHMKVILETGELKEHSLIHETSVMAIESGADFIKTSTGKISPAASPEAVAIMCDVIAQHHKITGKRIGIKPAGGIRTGDDAILYQSVLREFLDSDWLHPSLFRIGASSLLDNLLDELREIR